MANVNPQGSSHRPGEQGPGSRFQPESTRTGGIASTMAEKAQDVASGARDTIQEWGSSAADVAGQAKQRVQDFATSAAHRAEDWGEDVTSLIRRYPIPALLLGVGAGFLLAQLMHRD